MLISVWVAVTLRVSVAVVTTVPGIVDVVVTVLVDCRYVEQNALAPTDRVLERRMNQRNRAVKRAVVADLRIPELAENIVRIAGWIVNIIMGLIVDWIGANDLPSPPVRSTRPSRILRAAGGLPGSIPSTAVGTTPAMTGLTASKNWSEQKDDFILRERYHSNND